MLVDTSARCVVLPDTVICAPAAFVTVTTQAVSASTAVPVIVTLPAECVTRTGSLGLATADVISPIPAATVML